ncbi:hypothetical protein BOX15_Mlig019814g4 [Macrostomum lignano]|uniref:TNFR-Cys domain-containing protein n=2 Tax=Macrostomum lignano TaxID=282301 RepID=A0A1I8FWS6_9PLAT|nr:hypothetical protein BOX15_Mlig019814g4 [Macrostomum lignano]
MVQMGSRLHLLLPPAALLLLAAIQVQHVSGAGGGSRGDSGDCGESRYRDEATGRCRACPNCADYLAAIMPPGDWNASSIAAAPTTPAHQVVSETAEQRAARFDICAREPRCRGEEPEPVRQLLVRDRSDLEPLGLGSAAAVVGGICLIAGAVVLGRHLRQRNQQQQQRQQQLEHQVDGNSHDAAAVKDEAVDDNIDNVQSSAALSGGGNGEGTRHKLLEDKGQELV